MSESRDGVSVAATRQNAGSFAKGTAPRRPGAEKWPAPTTMICVIFSCGSYSDWRLSQVAAKAAEGSARTAVTSVAAPPIFERSHGALLALVCGLTPALQAWGGTQFPIKFPHPLNQSRVCWLEKSIREHSNRHTQLKRDDGNGEQA